MKKIFFHSKYRYLFSGNIDPNDGGFIAGVESPISEDLSKEYSVQEMVNSLVDIANSFGTTAEVEYNLRVYLEQIRNISDNRNRSNIRTTFIILFIFFNHFFIITILNSTFRKNH